MKVGVIGMGVMGENHLRVYKKLGVEVVGICDIKYDSEKGIKNTYCFNDYKDLIKLKPDIISITVPTKLHRKIAISCINAGINVLIEKPMAPNVRDCDRIIRFAKKKNVKVMVGHIERFNPAIIELKKHLSDIGEIYKISAKRVGPFHPRIRDVGVTMDLAIHDIDIMTWLIGEINEHASVRTSVITNNEDTFNAIIGFKNGPIGTIETDWVSPEKVRTLEIVGENGKFSLDYLNKRLFFISNNLIEKNIEYILADVEPLELELASFIKSIESDMEPEISGEDGRKAVYYTEKFYRVKKIENEYKTCVFCGNKYKRTYQHNGVWKKQKYCNPKCRGKAFSGEKNPFYGQHHTDKQRKKWSVDRTGRKCSEEWIENMSIGSTGIFPTLETRIKQSMIRTGETIFTGFRKPIKRKIYISPEYSEWHLMVLGRDNFTCQKCGIRGVSLHVHHIKRFSIIIEENKIRTLEQAKECEELWDVNNGITLCKKCHQKEHPELKFINETG